MRIGYNIVFFLNKYQIDKEQSIENMNHNEIAVVPVS